MHATNDKSSEGQGEATTLACSNDCDHGCDIVIYRNLPWPAQIIACGWIAVLWSTEEGVAEHDVHRMAFCDPGCMYEHIRARMLNDPRWAPKLHAMDSNAVEKASDLREHHQH